MLLALKPLLAENVDYSTSEMSDVQFYTHSMNS